jgi:hypothetical protein
LDNLGISFVIQDNHGFSPAGWAAEFGRVAILQWFWTRGALALDPAVGWTPGKMDPIILIVAAERGHLEVLHF